MRKILRKIRSCYGITELGGALSLSNYKGKLNSVGNISKKIKFKILKNKLLLLNTKFMMYGFMNLQNNKIRKIITQKFINTGDLANIENRELYLVEESVRL